MKFLKTDRHPQSTIAQSVSQSTAPSDHTDDESIFKSKSNGANRGISSGANFSVQSSAVFVAVLAATGGVGLMAQGTLAQSSPANIQFDSGSGAVRVNNNAFILQTGEFNNTSNIPRPAGLPATVQEGVGIEVLPNTLVPSTVELRTDVDYINRSFNELINATPTTTYILQNDSIRLTTQFNVSHQVGQHSYGEGINATVSGPDGDRTSGPVFVRGDRVNLGPNGEVLPEANQIIVRYGAADTVKLQVLNLRDNNASPNESGIYFSADGQFIVEDFQNGGDFDFNDGGFLQISGGQGEALVVQEDTETSESNSVEERILPPEIRTEELTESDVIAGEPQTVDIVVSEERTRGSIEYPDAPASSAFRLGHAVGAVTANDQQLVYGVYTDAAQITAGSDGIGITGQLPPLVNNPAVPPTLLSGNLNFNPTVGDNQAGLTATIGVTQFLTPTHRLATDIFGNAIASANPDDRPLVEPTGLFSNRRLVGYVPSTPGETVVGTQPVASVNGVFELPADQAVVVNPPNSQQVGRGDANYTDNVGGLLIERASGEISFMPQWTKNGYAQTPITLAAGEARRIIYALVPQQANQALQLGETYMVTKGFGGYRIANGDFLVISADRNPESFVQESAEVYAVEDTLPGNNAVTAEFNGVRGLYAQQFGAPPVPTLDVTLPASVDARVGNTLLPLAVLAGDAGQQPFFQTDVAAGFFLGGSLTGGIGNQRDTLTRTTATTTQVTDQLRIQQTVNTYMTLRRQRDVITQLITETTRDTGTAAFNIDSQGLLGDVVFTSDNMPMFTSSVTEIDRQSTEVRDPEVLVDQATTETRQALEPRIIASDQSTETTSESYPNAAPLQGEATLGGILNFGNTPWTAAANTLSAELFARDTVIGLSSLNGTELGLRAQMVFHPFGEVQREAYQYDAAGNAVALYQTKAVMDADGKPVVQMLSDGNGNAVELPVNQFMQDQSGDRIPQMVGTGRSAGPGIYLRVENLLSGGVGGTTVAGGVEFSF